MPVPRRSRRPPSTPRRRGSALLAAVLAVVVPTAACGPGAVGGAGAVDDEPAPLRVAAGPDPESTLLAAVVVVLLEDAGVPAEVTPFADARDSRRALELGDVEVRIGYSGESWLEVLGRADPPADPRASVTAVRQDDLARGIAWLAPVFAEASEGGEAAPFDAPPANATFAFVVAGPPSVDADLRTVSQLAARLAERPEATVCVDPEFGRRPDGLPAVLRTYSVRSDRPFLAADPAEAVLGVVAGDCLAGLTTATDGAAWRAGLRPLVDDLTVFPAFVPLPQVRVEVLEAVPQVGVALRPLVAGLTTAELGRANARVVGGADVARVAEDLVARLRARVAGG